MKALVALTGIERAKSQFSTVQFGLTLSFYVQSGTARWRKVRYGCSDVAARWQRTADNMTRSRPAKLSAVGKYRPKVLAVDPYHEHRRAPLPAAPFLLSGDTKNEICLRGEPNEAAEIARNLHGRKQESGWVARCPAHEDHNPSLSLKDADDGRVLVKCHAGCHAERGRRRAESRKDSGRNVSSKAVSSSRPTITRDEAGQLLYQVVRTEPKDFFQRRPDGFGGWIWKKGPRQVLYRLPEVFEAPSSSWSRASGCRDASRLTASSQRPTPAGRKRRGFAVYRSSPRTGSDPDPGQ